MLNFALLSNDFFMSIPTMVFPIEKLINLGLKVSDHVHYQSSPESLVKDTIRKGEGRLSDRGALVINTGEFTGRSPRDKFTVRDSITESTVNWNEMNLPLEPHYFDIIFKKTTDYLNGRPELWVRDSYACADPHYRMNIRIVNEKPWLGLFAYNMFLRPEENELEGFSPDWHILSAPGLRLNPKECGTRQQNAVVVSFRHKMILIVGTGYTGEMKKAIFYVLNFLLPRDHDVLSMHCSANIGERGDTALFFGLSGTGKTTLSADPTRRLIGDDEHGWDNNGVFNFEGGCYAKCVDLSEEKEPEIYRAIRPGALVENVSFFPGTNTIDFANRSITENTRVSYPIDFIGNAQIPSVGGIPENIFFLTCDAYGVLPPLSRLEPSQAMYQFISGYTAKVAGTETGILEPKATFSACFGAPFLPLHPAKYASMLGSKMRSHNVKVWLVNTGWIGGGYGKGSRIKLAYTRTIISAVLDGSLGEVEYKMHPIFKTAMPSSCPGIPSEILNPRNAWTDKLAYDANAKMLASYFTKNFEKYRGAVSAEILSAAPVL
jgi:phosphoenolpyruvate carboxykinase (ATP)